MRIPAALLIFAGLAGASSAQTPAASYVGRSIDEIHVFVENRATMDPALLELLDTRVGQPLSMVAVRETITHLYSLGRFQDVRVDASNTPAGGVSLRFDLVPLHSVQKISFRGSLELSEGLLRRTVTERFGSTPSISRAADAAHALEQLYEDHGYFRTRIQPISEERHDPDRTILTFDVDAGPRATIRQVTIDGDIKTSRLEFLRRLGASAGHPYQRVELQQRLSSSVGRLRRRGFYEATATFTPVIAEDEVAVDLTIDVDPGPLVTLRFEGDRIPAERLKQLVPVEREGSVDEDLLEDSEIATRGYLQQQGYWKAEVSRHREDIEGGVTLVFRVNRGRQYRVSEGVEIQGQRLVPLEDLRPLILLKPGDLYIESQLSAAAAAIRELYRQRGFASADVKTAVNELPPPRPGEGLVRPVIVIDEGPRTVVREIRIAGNAAISEGELRSLVTSTPGTPYYQPRTNADRDAILLRYLNTGYSSADVSLTPQFSPDRDSADLVFNIQEGPQTVVDHILIIGNTHTDPQVILNEMRLKPGAPLGLEDQMESRRRLSALGLFRRVQITELRHGSSARRDLLVTVDEAPATTIGYGGGLEATQRLRATSVEGEAREHVDFAPRGFFDIGRRNLGGRNRSADLYTRLSLHPQNAANPSATGFGFTEYRIVGTYREPRAIVSSDLTIIAALEQGSRSSFNFVRRGINADLFRRLTPSIRVSGRYSLNTTKIFDEQLERSEETTADIDRLFPRVRLSALSGSASRDTRDDVVDPERGTFLSAEGSVAARSFGGEVGFVKTYVQGYWFRRLSSRQRIVFATRAAVGLADGFPREVAPADGSGAPVIIEDLPASERFFAGGDSTIRGFALDSVGTPDTISDTGFPQGGNAVLILNGELRIPVWGGFGAALFVDGGNVFDRVTDFAVGQLRGATGFGIRYRSPLGPIRVDLGFKMDRRVIAGRREPRTALHFSIGQAF
jgi:outer membrane protein insertion porin family